MTTHDENDDDRVAGLGLEGDHRSDKTPGSGRQVTLISREFIDQIAHFTGKASVDRDNAAKKLDHGKPAPGSGPAPSWAAARRSPPGRASSGPWCGRERAPKAS